MAENIVMETGTTVGVAISIGITITGIAITGIAATSTGVMTIIVAVDSTLPSEYIGSSFGYIVAASERH